MCRSRQELSNKHLLTKFGFDTAENEPLKVWQQMSQKLEKMRTATGRLERRARPPGREEEQEPQGLPRGRPDAPGRRRTRMNNNE